MTIPIPLTKLKEIWRCTEKKKRVLKKYICILKVHFHLLNLIENKAIRFTWHKHICGQVFRNKNKPGTDLWNSLCSDVTKGERFLLLKIMTPIPKKASGCHSWNYKTLLKIRPVTLVTNQSVHNKFLFFFTFYDFLSHSLLFEHWVLVYEEALSYVMFYIIELDRHLWHNLTSI